MLKVGDALPDLTLEAHDGRPVRLLDRNGRKLLLWYYPKADTPG
jgi:thioredoxin-dependent peroxiredoxin